MTSFLVNRRSGRPEFGGNIHRILDDFQSSILFHQTLEGYAPVPLEELPALADLLGIGEILIKDEGRRFGIAAIKMLGASYAMHRLLENDPSIRIFCTATDGNHGRSVAWSASRMGKKAVVFVPGYTVEARIRNIEREKAEVIKIDGSYDDAVEAARRYAHGTGNVLIQDMAWKEYEEIPALITAGYYTQMNEIRDQWDCRSKPFDLVILQCGNGSWPSAVSHFIRSHRDFTKTRIILVEPCTCDSVSESIRRGEVITTAKSQKTIMAGLNCGTPSTLALTILKSEADACISIEDRFATEAMKRFYYPLSGDPQLEAGESGAAGLAGLLAILREAAFKEIRKEFELNQSSRVLLFNTETITDPDLFSRMIR
jgi:diaminopropionate ammonia-lyase